jgi:hypothetical protein
MDRKHWRAALPQCLAFVMTAAVAACGDDASSSEQQDDVIGEQDASADAEASDAGSDAAQSVDAGPCGEEGEHDSTFAAIQKVIFEGKGCTNDMCHGAAKTGGLDLREGAAYYSLHQAASQNSPFMRVMPGEPDESFLYNKLRAATDPGSVEVGGSPMPSGAEPLSADHLEVVRRWIEAGAPREGSVGDGVTGRSDRLAELLGACLPEASPLSITALEPPAPDEGVQIAMAQIPLRAESEIDVCFAQYYDLSDVVPAQYQDPEQGVFFVNGQRTRQDPHSHHLVVSHPGLDDELVNDPSFGQWACRGGDLDGDSCDPVEGGACGAGICASEPQAKPACLGFGPPGGGGLFGVGGTRITGAQTAQYYRAPRDGVYEAIPIKGIVYMNSHAFNLTHEDTKLHAWINLFYAKDPQRLIKTLAITQHISIAAGQAPFTTQTHCAEWVAPQGSEMFVLGSHTHKRGRNFTVELPDGTQIYQSSIYSDPVEKLFEPPMKFDAEDPAERTLKYCADYNNGVLDDGSPDIDLVTRLSTMPPTTTCTPVACVTGKTGEPCATDTDCDSSPGAGDGWCDACPITAGQTTENEMFVLSPAIVLE